MQIIKTPGGEELVLLAKTEYDALLSAVADAEEDAADVAIYDARKAEDLSTLPAEVSMAIVRGESRLKALRKWRGLTQDRLAAEAGVTQGFLSDLEARRRAPSHSTLEKLATVLDVPLSWIEG
jgi:DNA-binding XRE family transcriptional regulator